MSETIIAAVITAIGVIIGGALGAYGRIKAASLGREPATRPTKKSLVIYIIFGIAIGGALGIVLGVSAAPRIREVIAKLSTPSIPLEIKFHHDFENRQDPTDVNPWKILPEGKGHSALISHEESHSGSSSLRLKINIQKYIMDPDENDYGGIGILAGDYPDLVSKTVVACVAWVLLPESEHAQDSDMHAHIIGYTYNQNGDYMGVYSELTKLLPGTWTPIFWGATYSTEFKELMFDSFDRTTNELYLNVFDFNQPYNGSVYIDDITCYTEKR